MKIDTAKITIVNQISIEDFLRLRESVAFQPLSANQAEMVLKYTTYISVALYNEKVIGMTRLLFDFGTDAYITDVIVDPGFQGCGIGSVLLNDIISFLKEHTIRNTQIACSLYANKGKEEFYKHFGFEKLPNEKYGFGMLVEV